MPENESPYSPLSIDSAIALVKALATDDDFRDEFVGNPAQALRRIGVPEEDARRALHDGACTSVSKLASKDEFSAAAEQLVKHLMSKAVYQVPHCFEAGSVKDSFSGTDN